MASTPNVPTAEPGRDSAPPSKREGDETERYAENRKRMAAALEQFLDSNEELMARLAK